MEKYQKTHTTVNSNSRTVVSATCGRCHKMRSRSGAWLFHFDVTQFLCSCCIASMERVVLRDYQRAESLMDGGLQ